MKSASVWIRRNVSFESSSTSIVAYQWGVRIEPGEIVVRDVVVNMEFPDSSHSWTVYRGRRLLYFLGSIEAHSECTATSKMNRSLAYHVEIQTRAMRKCKLRRVFLTPLVKQMRRGRRGLQRPTAPRPLVPDSGQCQSLLSLIYCMKSYWPFLISASI